jgi:hypothetical protein
MFTRSGTGRLISLPQGEEGDGWLSLTKKAFKKRWKGAAQTILVVDFAEAFRGQCEHNKNCIAIASNFVEKVKNT